MAWHNPFDLQYWFVNVLAGNTTIFLALSFLLIASLSAMFRMPTIITGLMFLLFIVMLSGYTGNFIILALAVLGLIIGWSIVRLLR